MQSWPTQEGNGYVSGMIATCVDIRNVAFVPAGPSKYASIKKPRQKPEREGDGPRQID